jgi:hypothetical protein
MDDQIKKCVIAKVYWGSLRKNRFLVNLVKKRGKNGCVFDFSCRYTTSDVAPFRKVLHARLLVKTQSC